MIFKFTLFSDEEDDFRRVIEISSDANYKELNDAILDSVGYTKDQMTTFYVLDEEFERLQQISVEAMDTESDEDSYLMDETNLEEFASEKGDRLEFIFDMLSDRSFIVELTGIKLGEDIDKPKCTKKTGKAPKQINDDMFTEDLMASLKGGKKGGDNAEDYGFGDDQGFDSEEISDFGDLDEYSDIPDDKY